MSQLVLKMFKSSLEKLNLSEREEKIVHSFVSYDFMKNPDTRLELVYLDDLILCLEDEEIEIRNELPLFQKLLRVNEYEKLISDLDIQESSPLPEIPNEKIYDEKSEISNLNTLTDSTQFNIDISKFKEQTVTEEESFSHWGCFKQTLDSRFGTESNRVKDVDRESQKVLDRILHFRDEKSQKIIKGLVIGYVQSGKTENMIALSSKALDSGYEVVLVLSGLLNSLRKQTQKRFDFDWTKNQKTLQQYRIKGQVYLGNESSEISNHLNVVTYASETETLGDFNKIKDGLPDYLIEDGAKPKTLMVIKKNKKVLEELQRYLKYLVQQNGGNKLTSKLLIIDDESDQATINTKSNTQDVSAINKYFNEIAREYFDNFTYVGYTATPYSNVFVDIESEDIFPDDFILNLSKKPGYIGVDELYGQGDDMNDLDLFQFIGKEEVEGMKKVEDFLYLNSRMNSYSLKGTAIERAVFNYYFSIIHGQERGLQQPYTLLINPSHLTNTSNKLTEAMNELRERLISGGDGVFSNLEYYYDNFVEQSNNIHSQAINRGFAKYLPESPIDKKSTSFLRDQIKELSLKTKVKTLNSGSQDVLDYTQNSKFIVIGGNKLSRGLSLDGLVGAYFPRSPRGYDTLMQMGRWFGYRSTYIDLLRVYSDLESYDNFVSLVKVESDIRKQVVALEESGVKPKEFPPSVIKIAGMNIVSANKMGAATRVHNKISSRHAFDKVSVDILKNSSTNIQTVNEMVKGLNFQRIGERQLYYAQVGESFVIDILKNVARDIDESAAKSYQSYLLENNIFKDKETIFFLRGSEVTENVSPISIGNNNGDFQLTPVKRKVSKSGLKYQNVLAPADIEDISKKLGKDSSEILFLGVYLLNFKVSMEFTLKNYSIHDGELELYRHSKLEDLFQYVPVLNLPLKGEFFERWGQTSTVMSPSIV